MAKIAFEIDEKYQEHLSLVRELILNENGEEIKTDSEAVEVLLESFVGFLQQQALENPHDHDHEDGCGCGHDHH